MLRNAKQFHHSHHEPRFTTTHDNRGSQVFVGRAPPTFGGYPALRPRNRRGTSPLPTTHGVRDFRSRRGSRKSLRLLKLEFLDLQDVSFAESAQSAVPVDPLSPV